jgi:hypothetical protein
MELRDDHRIRVKDDVLSRVLDGEAVLLDLASGTYFGLDVVATELWEMFRAGETVGAIRARIGERYQVDDATLRRDLGELVAELVRRGLVEVAA